MRDDVKQEEDVVAAELDEDSQISLSKAVVSVSTVMEVVVDTFVAAVAVVNPIVLLLVIALIALINCPVHGI